MAAFTFLLLCILQVTILSNANEITSSKVSVWVIQESNVTVTLYQKGQFYDDLHLIALPLHDDIVEIYPPVLELPGVNQPNSSTVITYDIHVVGRSPGQSIVNFNVTPTGYLEVDNLYLIVTVMISYELYYVSLVLGWIYSCAWAFQIYPQFHLTWKAKSVIGLDFDLVALNLVAAICYSIFNCGLKFIPQVQAEYKNRFPRGVNPALWNDVFFSLHSLVAALIIIWMCLSYERGKQRVSTFGRLTLVIYAIVVAVTLGLAWYGIIQWLDFMYACSYIKLSTTLIKYIPQAYLNYTRKSTSGWSIIRVSMDFTGGILSVLQMVCNAHNYNDWISIFGDFTKFGLGVVSIFYDTVFIGQHYYYMHSRVSGEKTNVEKPKI